MEVNYLSLGKSTVTYQRHDYLAASSEVGVNRASGEILSVSESYAQQTALNGNPLIFLVLFYKRCSKMCVAHLRIGIKSLRSPSHILDR